MRTCRAGGYECLFVDAPHEDDYCIICQLPARDPQQIKCDCAILLCGSCYARQSDVAGTCPTCRERLDAFPDRNISRRLRGLRVECTSSGCPWQNELRQLDDHLDGCGYAIVPCSNDCGALSRRSDLERHLSEECPLRRHVCVHCKEVGSYAEMTGDHLSECPDVTLHCGNKGCEVVVARRDLDPHFSECPKEAIDCPYADIGCSFVSLREAMGDHESSTTPLHLGLAQAEICKLRNDLKKLKDSVYLKCFKMPHFGQHKAQNKSWYSPGFYTHPNGYKMCLRVMANGSRRVQGTHLSVYLHVIKGRYDNNLLWPFRYSYRISLLNQLRDGDHHTCSSRVDDDENNVARGDRVLEGQFGTRGFGAYNFIPHSELGLQEDDDIHYLMDDCLNFSIEVDVHAACKPWLIAVC